MLLLCADETRGWRRVVYRMRGGPGRAKIAHPSNLQRVEDGMAKIKHIALSTQDPEQTARFYIDVFGMKQIGRASCRERV